MGCKVGVGLKLMVCGFVVVCWVQRTVVWFCAFGNFDVDLGIFADQD